MDLVIPENGLGNLYINRVDKAIEEDVSEWLIDQVERAYFFIDADDGRIVIQFLDGIEIRSSKSVAEIIAADFYEWQADGDDEVVGKIRHIIEQIAAIK